MSALSPAQGAARMRASPAAVTIGVPVFNGAAMLEESLACLARQTRRDFLVVVSDNASTDATPDIAAEWAARDPRFVHVRQPENLGPIGNFAWLLDHAASPYFMWRAHDDLSGDDQLERLARVLDQRPDLALAVGNVETRVWRDRWQRSSGAAYRPPAGTWRPLRIVSGLRRTHECWLYGLWRRAALAEMFGGAIAAYPHPWGSDHLTVGFAALEERIGGDEAALFIQRIKPSSGDRRSRPVVATASLLAEWRSGFRRAMRSRLDTLPFSRLERAILSLAIERETEARVAPLFKMLRRRVKERLGLYAHRRG